MTEAGRHRDDQRDAHGARRALDVSGLPDLAFGPRSLLWWGGLGFMVLEGVAFLTCAAAYLYLRKNFNEYPPLPTPRPDLVIPTINLVIMVASTWTCIQISRHAKAFDVRGTAKWLFVSVAFATVFLILRVFEFGAVHVRWDSNAYGTVVWAILVLHTFHVVADALENAVVGFVFIRGPVLPRHFVDANEGAFYWFFVVVMWVLMYFVVFIGPYVL